MIFSPYVLQKSNHACVHVEILPSTAEDIDSTRREPRWQTDWTSAYLSNPTVEKYAMKAPDGELIALGAYQITGRKAYVYIIYAESAPHSNPTMESKHVRKYYGIGAALIAFGIKFSIDHGCRGDVVFEAKTDELAKHYAEDFHARQIPSASSGGPKRFMLADEDAWRLFSRYLTEEG